MCHICSESIGGFTASLGDAWLDCYLKSWDAASNMSELSNVIEVEIK